MHFFSFLLMLCFTAPLLADAEIERLLQAKEEPAGVVFEILEDDDDALGWALPKIAKLSARLRERFPDLAIAVVTHGREQFALLADESDGLLAPIHEDARQLRADEIDLHVCGTHASWDGYTPEDFPDYIDVSPSAPAQIRDYQNLGFVLIVLQGPDYD
ncbi:MAG: DsrE family protein [Candidatus Thiodiazotropha lotti]|uniref:DsrE family protein n=1 Tax=Candidatus Thiodiazotropha lotti TaxID=2792787 RepID=A0A9E4N119_9GAMM|nr:DsrE family protein [Candidatus Thiodiazotropha lotti]MCG7921396.1 DsrE family protein [Candidatus Thiodiazotropha lotti]MCG7941072.1 DsrE family protein [Candidatus Thiodiazotropha lotti]MCG7987870.1 DsrE family protein [Candidatus Thiodiazotropha lotti]MCG8005128.1 DsrE family protein [Candidatus Thiodiazotropha lotti]